jgi:hypothetical protein
MIGNAALKTVGSPGERPQQITWWARTIGTQVWRPSPCATLLLQSYDDLRPTNSFSVEGNIV